MKPIIQINKNPKKINKQYFDNYGGACYSDSYTKYTINAEQVFNELLENNIDFDTLIDLGCASGELVRDFRLLGIKAYGIENNKEILKKCIVPQFCINLDIKRLNKIKPGSFDIAYANSFMYFFPNEIQNILKQIHPIINKAVYLCIPYLEETTFKDPYRVFLASQAWWENEFKQASFFKVSKNIYQKL